MKGFEVDFIHDTLDRVSGEGKMFSITNVIDRMSSVGVDLGLSYMAIRSILLKEINDRIHQGLLISPLKGRYLVLGYPELDLIGKAKVLNGISLGFLEGSLSEDEFKARVSRVCLSINSK